MTKLLALIGTLGIATLVFFGVLSFQDKSKIEELEKSSDRGKLRWHAEVAKAKGKQSCSSAAERCLLCGASQLG